MLLSIALVNTTTWDTVVVSLDAVFALLDFLNPICDVIFGTLEFWYSD